MKHKAEFKKASGALVGLFDKNKTDGRKSRDTVPLNKLC
jgi:hypothetical protein